MVQRKKFDVILRFLVDRYRRTKQPKPDASQFVVPARLPKPVIGSGGLSSSQFDDDVPDQMCQLHMNSVVLVESQGSCALVRIVRLQKFDRMDNMIFTVHLNRLIDENTPLEQSAIETILQEAYKYRKLKFDRHSLALQYVGRLRGMGWERWPKIVGEALSRLKSKGTSVDYVRSLVARYQLQTCWEDEGWNEKVWKKAVVDQVEKEGKRAWREEVEGRQDLGDYKDRQLVLERADYIANSSGDKIRAEIKEKCEWGIIL